MSNKDNNFLNPQRKFRSVEEASNYFKAEMSDEKVMEYLKKADMPINLTDPRINNNVLISYIKMLPERNSKEKLYKYYMMVKTVRRSYEVISGLSYDWTSLWQYLSRIFGLNEKEIVSLDRSALTWAKNYFAKGDRGKIIELNK